MRKKQYETSRFIDERVKSLVPKFERLTSFNSSVRKKGSGKGASRIPGWMDLATHESKILKRTYPDDRPESQKTYSTCTSQISRLKTALLNSQGVSQLKDPANIHKYRTIVNNFGDMLSYKFSEYKQRSNEYVRQDVETRSKTENRITINIETHLDRAYDILSEPEQYKWYEVSCAIALTSGRRMAETHMSGEYVTIPGSSHELMFRGQLKGKDRKINGVPLHRHWFKIPTLTPAYLIIQGIEYLNDCGKRFEFDNGCDYEVIPPLTKRVNDNLSRYLSTECRDNWAIVPEKMRYHLLRGIYFRAALENSDCDLFDFERFGQEVLGDSDMSAIKSYIRFRIEDDSNTLIYEIDE